MEDTVVVVFILAFSLQRICEGGLLLLNQRHAARHGHQVPPALRDRFDAESARKAQAYTLARGRLAMMGLAMGTVLTPLALFSGVLPWASDWLHGLGLRGAHHFVGVLLLVLGATALVGLPLRLYGTFGVEARFGFNRMGLGLWLLDRLKGVAVGAALLVPLLYATHALFRLGGAAWWLWLFAFLLGWQVLLLWLYPWLIAPLFNRFTPLPGGAFREALLELAGRAGFRPGGLYVMDASRRSGHSNAYFTGLFRPRIVLFDTLLTGLEESQALAVLAHEIGHFRLRHVFKRLALSLGGTLLMLWVLSLLMQWPPVFAAFGFAEPSLGAALLLVGFCGGALTFPLEPLGNLLSRAHEFAADRYSWRLHPHRGALASALVRLARENLGNLNPHPWYAAWHYSHPALGERLAAIAALEAAPPT